MVLPPVLAPQTPEAFGRKVFELIGSEKPSSFQASYWATKLMTWSMSDPVFKVNLFRLVDVLPQLRTWREISLHVREYLGDSLINLRGISRLAPILRWALRAPPHSPLALGIAYMVKRSVEQMASLFIAGEDPHSAVPALRALRANGLAFTVDLLGEFSVSEREANVYLSRYMEALDVLGTAQRLWPEAESLIAKHPGEATPACVSVKLSALYSQCGPLNFERSVAVLSEKLSTIVRKADEVGAQVYVDAEDTGNNPVIYAVFKRVFGEGIGKSIPYPGIVVQAYAKSASDLIDDLLGFAHQRGSPIAIRLVKGAYWDQETIAAEQNGWVSPLFARKESSDANFEALSRKLIDHRELVLPAFASHNIRSLSHACTYAFEQGLSWKDFELQMLYGMAEPIARAFRGQGALVRMYVPLGDMIVGMGYLVRRLLENTSNESFLRHTFVETDEIAALLRTPVMHPDDQLPPSPQVANYV